MEIFLDTPYYFNTGSCYREWKAYFSKQAQCSEAKEHTEEILNGLKSLQLSASKEEISQRVLALSKTTTWNSFVPMDFRRKWITQVQVTIFNFCLF